MRKILVLSIWEDMWSLGEGGGVPDEFYFTKYLTGRGIELHFLIPEPTRKRQVPEDSRLTYHTYPNIYRTLEHFPGLVQRIIRPFAIPRATRRRVRELALAIEPDLLLGFSHYSLYALHKIGKELGIPAVVKLFGVMHLDRHDLSPIKYWWCNYEQIAALRYPVDHYIVLNDGTRGDRALTRHGIPPEKISFLPNGMVLEWTEVPVHRKEARMEFGLPVGDILVVTSSRLVRSKRLDLFLKAASLIEPALLEQITLVVGGDGPERKKLEREARVLGLENKVIFTGMIKYEDMPRFLKASDIFVATNELTNMSMPPCEAMLCGVPVVVFDVAGTSDVVRDGETGLLVKDGDIEGLARKMELLVKDADRRKRLGKRAAEFGAEHFVSWDKRLQEELNVMEKLVRSYKPVQLH